MHIIIFIYSNRQEREIADGKLKDFHEQRSKDLQRVQTELNDEFNDRLTEIVRAERTNVKAKENIELRFLQVMKMNE